MSTAMNFLEELRSADHETKQRWLIILSTIATAIIVAVWLIYFNTLFPGPEPAPTATEGTRGFSFFGTIRSGASAAWQAIAK